LEDERRRRAEAETDLTLQTEAYETDLRSLRLIRRREERLRLRQEVLTEALFHANTELQRAEIVSAELSAVKGSAFYRAAMGYRRAVERVAPEQSIRRRVYRALVRALAPKPPDTASADRSDMVPFCLPTAADPAATIIIPAHNDWALIADCLRSIAEDASGTPYETIVVDDASTDKISSQLSHVSGVTIVRLNRNRGFAGAVNAGLEVARGRFVVLLNNDTVVRPGWLDALVDTAEESSDVGVVGAKLVHPDGRLREAGGIIWQDGSRWSYGHDQDASDPAYNFRRDVDYCSDACILVRRDLLDGVGGLDNRFSPGFYEDADLAFSARKFGYRVVYQPLATVVQTESASRNTNMSSGIESHPALNLEAFRTKWHSELAAQSAAAPRSVRLAGWRSSAGRALVIDHQLPTPNQDSGSRRMFELIRLLSEFGFGVTFIPHNGTDLAPYSQALRDLGVEVLEGPHRLPEFLGEVSSDLRLALLCRPFTAWQYLPVVRQSSPETKIIYDTVDLHFLRLRREAEVNQSADSSRDAKLHHDMELTLARAADATLVVSPAERDVLLHEDSSLKVHVVPNIHRHEHPGPPFAQREGILFVGSFPHLPNRDAAHWLVEDILPLIRHQLPTLPVLLVGSQPTDDIRELAGDGVRVLGWVPDLTDLYERARLFVAPLRYGAGMKGKVGESLAYGLPVVTTPIGAEGMGLQHEDDVLVAETAEDFASAVVRAYCDAGLWSRLATCGRRSILRRFSPDAVRPLLARVLADVGVPVAVSR